MCFYPQSQRERETWSSSIVETPKFLRNCRCTPAVRSMRRRHGPSMVAWSVDMKQAARHASETSTSSPCHGHRRIDAAWVRHKQGTSLAGPTSRRGAAKRRQKLWRTWRIRQKFFPNRIITGNVLAGACESKAVLRYSSKLLVGDPIFARTL